MRSFDHGSYVGGSKVPKAMAFIYHKNTVIPSEALWRPFLCTWKSGLVGSV